MESQTAKSEGDREESAVAEWLASQVAELLEIDRPQVALHVRLRDQGVDSALATRLLCRLSAYLGRPLPATLPWQYPTIEALAKRLANDSGTIEAVDGHEGAVFEPVAEEPIAIVGIGCRFPGGVRSPGGLWRTLVGKVDAVREVPKDRWDIEAYFDTDRSAPGKTVSRWGAFVDDIDRFDAAFFGISPREAAEMDPQQRVFLETAWEALEDGAIVPASLRGTRTGVFAGAMWPDHALLAGGSTVSVEQHTATGMDLSIIPARVSYNLGLQGPSIAVNTACSSSLVAVYLGMQSLRTGDSDLVLAGGINLILSPYTSVAMSKFGAMSPDGRCRAFDAAANGYVRGEGCGVVVLKPLTGAIRDGDHVYAVLRGGGVNNDGFSNGLSAPNPDAQEAVLRAAWSSAGIPPEHVRYVETHGPGTALGDPIEAQALGAVFGANRTVPLRIGSIKPNFGHLEAAAGVAGLIKTTLALARGALPPNLHFDTPNPNIDFESLKLEVQTKASVWPTGTGRRFAGVSSFGFGGTNCHLALEEAPGSSALVIPWGSDDADGLGHEAAALLPRLAEASVPRDLHEIAAEAAARAEDKPWRAAVVVSEPSLAAESVYSFVRGEKRTMAGIHRRPSVVFVCPGHGGQWLGMGRDLLVSEPVFARTLDACDRRFSGMCGWSVREELLAPPARSRLDEVDVIQPVLFSFEVALAALWRSWGIEPDAVVGNSLGEIVAAHVAGILSLEDACRVIWKRSLLIAESKTGVGAAAVVGLPAGEARAAIEGDHGICVAGHSSPVSVVLAGDADVLERALKRFEADEIDVGRIRMNFAPHSPHMDDLVAPLREAVDGITPRAEQVPMWSTSEDRWIVGADCSPEYWGRNLRAPVLFAEGIEALLGEGHGVFLELGPHPVLEVPFEQILENAEAEAVYVTSGRRHMEEREALMGGLAALHEAGVSADWTSVYGLPAAPKAGGACAVVLSAPAEEAVAEQAQRLGAWVEAHPSTAVTDIAYTAGGRRQHHDYRLAAIADTNKDLAAALAAAAKGVPHPSVTRGRAAVRGETVFVFPGQGAQWQGMGLELMREEPAFATAMADCDDALRCYTGWSVVDVLRGAEGAPDVARIDVVQPALFAVAMSLVALWRHWGVVPDAVVGHSQGEIVAGCVAGALDLTDAARVIAVRSRLLLRVAGRGGMAVVELEAGEVAARLEDTAQRDLSVAVSNSEQSTVVSGDSAALESWLTALESEGVFCRRINVDVASHGPQMEPLREDLLAELEGLQPQDGRIPIYSTVTESVLAGSEMTASYWWKNLRQPVRFGATVKRLVEAGCRFFVEVSPHPVLTVPVAAVVEQREVGGVVVPTLRRDEGGRARALLSLATLHVSGYPVEWSRSHPPGSPVALPTYRFQGERYRREQFIGVGDRPAGRHPLIGDSFAMSGPDATRYWETTLRLASYPWLEDHRVEEVVVLPGAAMLEMVLTAAAEVLGTEGLVLEEATLERPVILRKDSAPRLQVAAGMAEGGSCDVWIATSELDGWTVNARARVGRAPIPDREQTTLANARARCSDSLTSTDVYGRLGARGLHYGAAFRGIADARFGVREAVGSIRRPERSPSSNGFLVHPGVLDGCFQLAVAVAVGGGNEDSAPLLPASIDRLVYRHSPGDQAECHVTVAQDDDGQGFKADLTVFDGSGDPAIILEGLLLRRLASPLVPDAVESEFMELKWRSERPLGKVDATGRRWLLLGDRGGFAAMVAAESKRPGCT